LKKQLKHKPFRGLRLVNRFPHFILIERPIGAALYPQCTRSNVAANTITLSKRTIDALKPGAERFDVFDKSLRGFSLRVHPSGRKSFRFKYVHCSRQRVITIGEYGAPWTVESARIQAQKLRGLVAAGVDPADQRKPERSQAKTTLAELIERWLSEGRAAAPNKRDSSWAFWTSDVRSGRVALTFDSRVSPMGQRAPSGTKSRTAKSLNS
jgi:hypothetical protein